MRIVELTQQEAERLRDQIAFLYHRNMRACAHMGSFTYGDACRKMDDLVFHLGNGTCVAYVALDGDEVCGFVWAHPHRWRGVHRMYVSEIRTREGWRRRGIGTELLRRAARVFLERPDCMSTENCATNCLKSVPLAPKLQSPPSMIP